MLTNVRNYPLRVAIALVVLYVGAGGAAKLAGVPYVHSSFPKLGLPAWFGYFIGVYTPVLQAAPAFILLILSAYIFWTSRAQVLKFRPARDGTRA